MAIYSATRVGTTVRQAATGNVWYDSTSTLIGGTFAGGQPATDLGVVDSVYVNNPYDSGVLTLQCKGLDVAGLGFDAVIPDSMGLTILGVQLTVTRGRTGNGLVYDDWPAGGVSGSVRLLVAGSVLGDNKAVSDVAWTGFAPSSWQTAQYGGAADTWSVGLTRADVIHSQFGARIRPVFNDLGGVPVITAQVTSMAVTVWWEIPDSAPTTAPDDMVGAPERGVTRTPIVGLNLSRGIVRVPRRSR